MIERRINHMTFDFASKMKTLRKSHDLTQEEFAERLGMSSQAVSKWETGTAMPDISMFPILANFFNVTTDELLGVDISRRQERVDALIEQGNLLLRNSERAALVEHYRNAVAEFPGEDELWFQLAWSLNWAKGITRTREEDLTESIRIYKSILERTKDSELITRVHAQLVYNYRDLHDYSNALTWAEKLPSLNLNRQLFISRCSLYKGSEMEAHNRDCLHAYIRNLVDVMMMCGNVWRTNPDSSMSIDESIAAMDTVIALLDLLYGENKLDMHLKTYHCQRAAAVLYLLKGDCEGALDRLEKALFEVEKHESYNDGSCYDSLLLKGKKAPARDRLPHTLWEDMLKYMPQEHYDPLRENPRFIAILDTLEAHAGENS